VITLTTQTITIQTNPTLLNVGCLLFFIDSLFKIFDIKILTNG